MRELDIPTKPVKTVPNVAAIMVDVRIEEDIVVVDILGVLSKEAESRNRF